MNKLNNLKLQELIESRKQVILKRAQHSPLEFQAYGYFLAENLNDLLHRGIYIRMAKNISRQILETAYHYVKESIPHLQGKNAQAKLFMWKVKQLKKLAK